MVIKWICEMLDNVLFLNKKNNNAIKKPSEVHQKIHIQHRWPSNIFKSHDTDPLNVLASQRTQMA